MYEVPMLGYFWELSELDILDPIIQIVKIFERLEVIANFCE
jgi:hypothetical protein